MLAPLHVLLTQFTGTYWPPGQLWEVLTPGLMTDEVGRGHAELLGPPLLSWVTWVLSEPQLPHLHWAPSSHRGKGCEVLGTWRVL